MATQTPRQRSAAARKAAATRKRNAARTGVQRTRTSARRTKSSARRTAKSAGSTVRSATGAASRRAEAELTGLSAVGRQAERALLIPVGATLAARDALSDAVTSRSRLRRQLDRFERRGATALSVRR